MIYWKESYRVGIDIIDEQHKRLFDIAEEAEKLMEMPEHIDKFDEIINILNELRDYVKYHFEQEEELLLEIKYKKFFEHKIAHNDFIEYIYSLDIEDIDKHQHDRGIKILRVLMDWLVEHVLERDNEWATIYKVQKC